MNTSKHRQSNIYSIEFVHLNANDAVHLNDAKREAFNSTAQRPKIVGKCKRICIYVIVSTFTEISCFHFSFISSNMVYFQSLKIHKHRDGVTRLVGRQTSKNGWQFRNGEIENQALYTNLFLSPSFNSICLYQTYKSNRFEWIKQTCEMNGKDIEKDWVKFENIFTNWWWVKFMIESFFLVRMTRTGLTRCASWQINV